MNHNKALVIVDAQRCFMPAEEGERLGVEGFGELTVPDGHLIVPTLNKLTRLFTEHGLVVATTGDAHPPGTAHFSDTPNFVTTWPAHGRAGTTGAELHPELIAAHGLATHFIKGDVVAQTPEDDDSYTGALAHRTHAATGQEMTLPDFLKVNGATKLYIGGLTIGDGEKHPLCVDSTAIDMKQLGFDVTVVTDAIEAVVPENRDICLRNLGAAGIHLATAGEVTVDILNTPEIIR